MTLVLVKHKVKDYPAWKKVFDGFADTRKKSGEKSFRLMHPDGDSNSLTLLFDWDTRANAEKFMHSDDLKTAMEKGGVSGQPNVEFLTEAAKGAL